MQCCVYVYDHAHHAATIQALACFQREIKFVLRIFLYDRIIPEKIPDVTVLPRVIHCTGVKQHIGRSHFSGTFEWRKAVSIDKVSK